MFIVFTDGIVVHSPFENSPAGRIYPAALRALYVAAPPFVSSDAKICGNSPLEALERDALRFLEGEGDLEAAGFVVFELVFISDSMPMALCSTSGALLADS